MIRPCYGKRRYLSKQPSVVRTRAREKAHDLHGKRPEGTRRSVPRQAARSHSAHRPSMFGADAREERGGKRGTVFFSLACVQFRVDVCPVESIKANNQLLLQPQGPQHRLIGGAVGLKGQRRAQGKPGRGHRGARRSRAVAGTNPRASARSAPSSCGRSHQHLWAPTWSTASFVGQWQFPRRSREPQRMSILGFT